MSFKVKNFLYDKAGRSSCSKKSSTRLTNAAVSGMVLRRYVYLPRKPCVRAVKAACGSVWANFARTLSSSLVRTISGKENILYYRELLVSENFFKHAGFHLFYPLQSFWAEIFFYYRELLVSEKFLYNTGFPLWFYSLRRVSGLFWAKILISFFSSSFFGSRFVK